MDTLRLGFIGAGQMAEAIANGLNRAGVLPPSRMCAADVSSSRRKVFESMGALVCSSNSQALRSQEIRGCCRELGWSLALPVPHDTSKCEVVESSDVLILAVKPQIVENVLVDLKASLTRDKLLVSIAAGITIKNLQKWAGDARIVRVMPNTPCLVRETAAVMSLGDQATPLDADLVQTLFKAVGKISVADERLLDAVTGLSASGPAFVYIAIEALADGGVAVGLPRDLSLSLAAQTVLGAAKMVLETGKHPGQLKDEVASPAGTTIAGIQALERAGFRAALMSAVEASKKRSEELSRM